MTAMTAPRWLLIGVALLLCCAPARLHASAQLPPEDPSATPPRDPSLPAPARAPAPPTIAVYTMGPGDYFFSLFGHAAICVTDEESPAGRCYNWGTTDFSNPLRLAWQVMRGRAQFWVGTLSLPRMVDNYTVEDRTLYRQTLRLNPAATARVIATLHRFDDRAASRYTYHNIRDNCTTRVRDLVDDALDGRFRALPGMDRPGPDSARTFMYEGFAGNAHLIAGGLLLFGRAIDRPADGYAAMFMPRVLREQIHTRLGIAPQIVYARRGPTPAGPASDGVWLLCAVGLVCATATLLLGRGRRTLQAHVLAALPLGLVGSLLFLLLVASPLPELRYNEVLFLCWPSDLLIPALPPPLCTRYVRLRCVVVAAIALLRLIGLLRQPLLGPLLWVVPVLAALALVQHRWPREAPAAHPANP